MIHLHHMPVLAIVLSSLAALQHDFVIDALPIGPAQWHVEYFPKQLQAELDEALQLPVADARALLAADNPRDRGIGIFVASFNGDLDALFAVTALLNDDRQTIPVGLGDPSGTIWIDGTTSLIREPCTVGGYLKTQYNVWLGLPPAMTKEEADETVRRVAQDGTAPEYAHYWATRYGLAIDDQARSVVMQEIILLPESLRWAVASEIASRTTKSSADARTIAATVSPTTVDLIRTRAVQPPPDPVYQREAERDGLYKRYDALTRSP
jgi:hypothetical protein